jgi:peptidoglycan/xylan/chitin deacetylase (PgdA/CDA1 family)
MIRTLLILLAAFQLHAASVWPGGKAYAVSLTYDDALESQIMNAGPDLDTRGLKATFFLIGSSPTLSSSAAAWKALAAKGHELANHTMHHPCPSNPGQAFPPKELWLEGYDAKRYAAEMDQCSAVLLGLGVKRPYTFAWPCGAAWVGTGKQDISVLAAQRFYAVRDAWGGIADPRTVKLQHVPAVGGDRPLPQMLEDLKKAKAQGGWIVFLFHGVGGDYLTTSNENHRGLLNALAADKDAWVAPFGKVAAQVIQIQKKR